MTNEEAKEVLYAIRGYYASLTAGYPKGKDVVALGEYMCSEVANACLMAIKALDQISHIKDRPCEACEFHKGSGCSKWDCVFEEYTAYEN